MRTDKDGRDVTELPGIWGESDALGVSLRVYKPPHPPDSWYELRLAVAGREFGLDLSSTLASDCIRDGEKIVKLFASVGVNVVHSGLYDYDDRPVG